ncbi:MAG: O-methyltransferase [Alphaproteobacteria bacterium]|nr:O-methyltransferase [Alphaproteobacteria bacterium]
MSETVWTAVDHYIDGLLIPADPALEAALDDSKNVGLPSIQVTPAQGKFLHLLARIQGARKILELGTLGGYSTIWLARSLPKDGRLITVEYEPKHAEVARHNILRASLEALVDIRISAALEALPKIIAEGAGPFDLIFIDADKKNIPAYFEFALKLSKPGSVIIVDNVVRDGKVIDAATSNPDIQGVRLFNEKLAAEPRVSATTLQTVGAKGYDGFTLALVTSAP